jgi:hypothetical protein
MWLLSGSFKVLLEELPRPARTLVAKHDRLGLRDGIANPAMLMKPVQHLPGVALPRTHHTVFLKSGRCIKASVISSTLSQSIAAACSAMPGRCAEGRARVKRIPAASRSPEGPRFPLPARGSSGSPCSTASALGGTHALSRTSRYCGCGRPQPGVNCLRTREGSRYARLKHDGDRAALEPSSVGIAISLGIVEGVLRHQVVGSSHQAATPWALLLSAHLLLDLRNDLQLHPYGFEAVSSVQLEQ